MSVVCAEAITSLDGLHLTWRLEELHGSIFSKIPGLASPSLIENLLVVINPNLDATAYVNELRPTASIRLARAVAAGDPVFVADILDMRYQELFEQHPWFLGGQHTKIERHTSLDDNNIPDYTGIRASDSYRDIFEVKPPFMPCFRKDGGFTAPFNDAWAQAERYLNFARQQRQYLRDEKGLLFENPRCFLIVGHGLSDAERQALRVKESFNTAITVLDLRCAVCCTHASEPKGCPRFIFRGRRAASGWRSCRISRKHFVLRGQRSARYRPASGGSGHGMER